MDTGLPPDTIFTSDLGQESKWSSYRDAASLGLLGADWAQTRTIAKNPVQYHETNKLLGEHPSAGKVNNYFLASLLGYYAASKVLPPAARDVLQYGIIGMEAGAVGRNKLRLGIGMTF